MSPADISVADIIAGRGRFVKAMEAFHWRGGVAARRHRGLWGRPPDALRRGMSDGSADVRMSAEFRQFEDAGE